MSIIIPQKSNSNSWPSSSEPPLLVAFAHAVDGTNTAVALIHRASGTTTVKDGQVVRCAFVLHVPWRQAGGGIGWLCPLESCQHAVVWRRCFCLVLALTAVMRAWWMVAQPPQWTCCCCACGPLRWPQGCDREGVRQRQRWQEVRLLRRCVGVTGRRVDHWWLF